MQGHHARPKSTPPTPKASPSSGAKHARQGGLTTRLRRRLRTYTAVDFLSTHIPGTSGPGEECLLLVNGRQVVGQLHYQFCATCAYGVITAISINTPFRDTGLDIRALSHLRSRHPGTTWRSTAHTGTEDDLLMSMRIPILRSPPPCPHAPALA
ncbi:hypothetical protein [Streptomyces sp. NPDC051921]|uniref:hypothetical protein n=1 Tax=Streptomyces sp. NPDC051921 TaxID=3155806 RepID=UPI00342F5875